MLYFPNNMFKPVARSNRIFIVSRSECNNITINIKEILKIDDLFISAVEHVDGVSVEEKDPTDKTS